MSASFHTARDTPSTLALRQQLSFGHRVTQSITTAARGAQGPCRRGGASRRGAGQDEMRDTAGPNKGLHLTAYSLRFAPAFGSR
jgi:hypothetical protein